MGRNLWLTSKTLLPLRGGGCRLVWASAAQAAGKAGARIVGRARRCSSGSWVRRSRGSRAPRPAAPPPRRHAARRGPDPACLPARWLAPRPPQQLLGRRRAPRGWPAPRRPRRRPPRRPLRGRPPRARARGPPAARPGCARSGGRQRRRPASHPRGPAAAPVPAGGGAALRWGARRRGEARRCGRRGGHCQPRLASQTALRPPTSPSRPLGPRGALVLRGRVSRARIAADEARGAVSNRECGMGFPRWGAASVGRGSSGCSHAVRRAPPRRPVQGAGAAAAAAARWVGPHPPPTSAHCRAPRPPAAQGAGGRGAQWARRDAGRGAGPSGPRRLPAAQARPRAPRQAGALVASARVRPWGAGRTTACCRLRPAERCGAAAEGRGDAPAATSPAGPPLCQTADPIPCAQGVQCTPGGPPPGRASPAMPSMPDWRSQHRAAWPAVGAAAAPQRPDPAAGARWHAFRRAGVAGARGKGVAPARAVQPRAGILQAYSRPAPGAGAAFPASPSTYRAGLSSREPVPRGRRSAQGFSTRPRHRCPPRARLWPCTRRTHPSEAAPGRGVAPRRHRRGHRAPPRSHVQARPPQGVGPRWGRLEGAAAARRARMHGRSGGGRAPAGARGFARRARAPRRMVCAARRGARRALCCAAARPPALPRAAGGVGGAPRACAAAVARAGHVATCCWRRAVNQQPRCRCLLATATAPARSQAPRLVQPGGHRAAQCPQLCVHRDGGGVRTGAGEGCAGHGGAAWRGASGAACSGGTAAPAGAPAVGAHAAEAAAATSGVRAGGGSAPRP
jgi:hypothetical protein